MGAHNTFARIAMDQAIEEKTNKNTQTPGITAYSFKLGAVVCYPITADYRRFYLFECLEKWSLREKCPNTEFFLVRIQSEYRKIRIRKNSAFGHFSRSG